MEPRTAEPQPHQQPHQQPPPLPPPPKKTKQGTELSSRNHINILSSDVVVALPGSSGTWSEIQLAIRYVRAWVGGWVGGCALLFLVCVCVCVVMVLLLLEWWWSGIQLAIRCVRGSVRACSRVVSCFFAVVAAALGRCGVFIHPFHHQFTDPNPANDNQTPKTHHFRYRKALILFLGEEGGEIELALDEELEDIRIAKSLDDVSK